MPSAPAETTTFTETDWAPSETSEFSCKSVQILLIGAAFMLEYNMHQGHCNTLQFSGS